MFFFGMQKFSKIWGSHISAEVHKGSDIRHYTDGQVVLNVSNVYSIYTFHSRKFFL